MPKILIPKIYTATYFGAKDVFTNKTSFVKNYFRLFDKGTPVYRFVGYRNFLPQQDKATATIWPNLKDDLTNRWTGLGADGKSGAQGLYMSMEENGAVNTSFPEVEHYQDSNLPPTQEVSYFNYQPKKDPVWTKVKAGELRSMFLFSLTQPVTGVDLQFDDSPNSLLQTILEAAKKFDNTAFSPTDTLKTLYFDPSDASFNRAIGNAVFEIFKDVDFFNTTSVRDAKSINFILRGDQGVANTRLKAEGRNTFFVDEKGKKAIAVYTIDDLLYNDKFETSGKDVLAPKIDLTKDLDSFKDKAKDISQEINWDFAKTSIDSSISKQVGDAISKMSNPFEQDIDILVKTLSTQDLQKTVHDTLANYVSASAQNYSGYADLYRQIGMEGIQSLLGSEITEPKYNEVSNATAQSVSYVTMTVRDLLLERKAHWLSQKSSDIQINLSQKRTDIQQTSGEIQTKQNELTTVQEQLKQDPTNQSLQQQVSQLQQEIGQLVQKEQQEETDKLRLENEETKNGQDAKDTEADRGKTETERKKRGGEIFAK